MEKTETVISRHKLHDEIAIFVKMNHHCFVRVIFTLLHFEHDTSWCATVLFRWALDFGFTKENTNTKASTQVNFYVAINLSMEAAWLGGL